MNNDKRDRWRKFEQRLVNIVGGFIAFTLIAATFAVVVLVAQAATRLLH